MKILIAEDDPNILAGLVELLEREGYSCTAARDGEEALRVFLQAAHDFVLLDIMMPKMSGYEVCREIRRQDTRVPILFLSAKSEEIDKVVGLELGADDYVMKPFGARELVARVRAIIRRTLAQRPARAACFILGDLQIYPDRLCAQRGEALIDLSPREIKLLAIFAQRRGQALDRDTLFNEGWGAQHYPNSRTLDQAMVQLRKKIERDPKKPEIIRTVHGIGYMAT